MMDDKWRPTGWDRIKNNILVETPVVFSPSTGYSKDQKEQLIEKTASAIIKELTDAGLIHSQEQGSPENQPAWFGARPAESADSEPKSESN